MDHLRLKENPSTCYLCGKKYQSERNCYKHVIMCHEEERASLCTVCGKSGMTKNLLRLHCLSKHDGLGWNDETKWLYCDICKGVKFLILESYDEHMYRFHNVDKPIRNEEKEAEETNQSIQNILETSKDEILIEEDSPWLTAPANEIQIVYENEIEESDDDHNETVIEFEVKIEEDANQSDNESVCDVEYLDEEFEEAHENTKDFDEQFDNTNNTLENFQCPQCNESFSRYFYYLHIWEHFRSPENPTICKLCDKEFKNEESCRKHFLFKHFEKFQVCDICGKGSMTQLELFHHRRSKHPIEHKEEVECRKRKREKMRDKRQPKYIKLEVEETNLENEICDPKEIDYVFNLDCPHCEAKFSGHLQNSTTQQHRHIWEEHQRLASDPMQCPHCDKHFETEFLTKKHYFFLHYEPFYSCDLCQKSNMTYKQMVDHIRHESRLLRSGIEVTKWDDRKGVKGSKKKTFRTKYTEEGLKHAKYSCQECGEKFYGSNQISRAAYFKHAWDEHGKGNNPKRCDKCNKKFDTEFYARKHFLHSHWEKTHICEFCSLGNLTKNQLYHHKAIVHNNANQMVKDKRPQLDCPFCCQKFKDPSKFENHKRIHQESTAIPKLICETCNKVYANIHSLKEHQRRAHIKVFSHLCRFCDRGFFSSGSRNLHEIQIHTKDYPFECRICGVQSAQLANLKLHIRRIHDFTNVEQIKETIVRLAPRKKRTKEEVEAQKVYVQHLS